MGHNRCLNKPTRVSLNDVRPDLHDPDQGLSDAALDSLRCRYELWSATAGTFDFTSPLFEAKACDPSAGWVP
ncbi:MAG: hypothetical protein EA381_07850 [Planctomycetaceae bacterium]|nr:MAG: hypothetical protein EA381_07850 [Planctomycetaceae bacterium]